MGQQVADALGTDESLRFGFGHNWSRFLQNLTEERIAEAESSLRQKLGVADLRGKTFLDVGSGSGLFSLAARRLGAQVHSFDFDADSVACTDHLRTTFFPGDADWKVERGSILDRGYLSGLGTFDVVYSWGVLHHTGSMWEAIDNTCALAGANGKLFIAIYNDQGGPSRRWTRVKRTYNRLPPPLRLAVVIPSLVHIWWKPTLRDLVRGKPFHTWRTYGDRGMSPWWDLLDWVGGYPFEVAKPEEIMDFCGERGFRLLRMVTHRGGPDCNEFVLQRESA